MPVAVNNQAIPRTETLAQAPATEEIPIAEARNTIDRPMDILMKAFQAWTFQLRKANMPRYPGYQTAMAYAIQADHPPLQTPMDSPPPNVCTGLVQY
jgi:hypothetical protein